MGKFNLLERLLPPEETIFYNCFEKATEICCKSAVLLNKITFEGVTDELVEQARTYKREANLISKETLNHLNTTFITPIDREDIQTLAFLLRRITKKISRVCGNFKVYRIDQSTDLLKQQAETLLKATDELKKGVSLLRNVSQSKEIIESSHRMKDLEHQGDEILNLAMEELFSGAHDALSVIKLRDVHKNLETALDVCYSVSDQMVNIALKHG